jgi:hypothetical protein
LASFAPLQLAPWNILSMEALSFHSRHYSTGRAPWNIDLTEGELFTRNAIPQGELSFSEFETFQISLATFKELVPTDEARNY